MLVVEANPDRCPTDPAQKRRPVSIGQIDHGIESPTAEFDNEPPLRDHRPLVQNQDLVNVRVSRQYAFRPAIHHHRNPNIRPCGLDGTQGRRGQQDVPDVAELDD